MRRNGNGTRSKGRHLSGVVALVAAVAAGSLAACSVTAGEASLRSTTTTGAPPAPAEPGDQFDGSGLPAPVSDLESFDGLVVYYASGRDQKLELVAVLGSTATVAWRHQAVMPYQSSGEAIWLETAEEGIPELERPSGPDGTSNVQLLDREGAARWSRSIDSPLAMPEPCRDRICVETATGPVSIGAISGRRYAGGTPPPKDATVVGSLGDRAIGVFADDEGIEPADGITGVPRLTEGASWTRTLSEIFGPDRLTPRTGWSASRFGDDWVLWLGPTLDPAPGGPTFPYTKPLGSVAGFASDDGAPLWHRSRTQVCFGFSSDEVAVLCSPKTVYPAENVTGTSLVSRLSEIDPATGSDEFVVDLREPLDLFDLGSRTLRLGPDQYLIEDGGAFRKLDLAEQTETKGSGREIGWCPELLQPMEVQDPDGDVTEYGELTAGAPCVLGDDPSSEGDLLGAVVDGTLPAVDDLSVVEAGNWTVWNEDGHLAGVARSR